MTVLVPTTLDEALAGIAANAGATLLAGGTDLMVEVNEGHRRFPWPDDGTTVIALNRIPELRVVDVRPGRRAPSRSAPASPGARSRTSRCASCVPALAEAARTVGSPQIRHAGTVGGNLATCSPAGDGLPGARRARRRGRARVGGRPARRCRSPSSWSGVKRTALAARRADRVDHAAVARRVAGLQQGRRAQRDGDRHRQRVRRDRPPDRVRCASRSARSARRSCAAPRPRRSPSARSTGRRSRSPTDVGDGVRRARRGREPTDRRPSLDRRVPPARRRRAGRAACCCGRSREAADERALHASTSTASTARSATPGWARTCSTCCASGSGCWPPRARASRASAARARCSSAGSSCARASCSRRRPSASRSSPSKGWRRPARRPTCSRRSSTPAPCSAASARPG